MTLDPGLLRFLMRLTDPTVADDALRRGFDDLVADLGDAASTDDRALLEEIGGLLAGEGIDRSAAHRLLDRLGPPPAGAPAAHLEPAMLEEFIAQARGQLDEWERQALALEQRPAEAGAALRRIIHTFKGDLGILDQDRAALICHALESQVDPAHTDLLLAGRDFLLALLDHLQGGAPAPDPGALIDLVHQDGDATPLATPALPGPQVGLAPQRGEATPGTATPLTGRKTQTRVLCDDTPPARSWSPADDPELVAEFLADTEDLLAEVERNLALLEADATDRGAIEAAFRAVHTIKGLAASFGYGGMTEATNHAEDLLDSARSGALRLGPRAIAVIQQLVDLLRRRLAKIAARAPSGEHTLRLGRELHEGIEAVKRGETVAPEARAPIEDQRPSGSSDAHLAIHSSVRVRSDRLDLLLDLVGELVSDDGASVPRGDAPLGSQRANVTRELQSVVTRLRLVPLIPVFDRMKRSAQRVARQLGKPIEIRQQGADTELDKSLVDQIGDVLVHLVNNAIDHGLEDAATRRAAGKPEVGTIELRAEHRGGRVMITVGDDGAGLDPVLIRERARELGLIGSDQDPSYDELVDMLFASGFSTRREATTVSGRGVGLDAVARQVERLQGHVAVHSRPGAGTRFELSLPLTLAIIDAMLLRVGGATCLLPTATVLSALRPGEVTPAPSLDGRRYADHRGVIHPVLSLRRILGCGGERATADEGVLILIDDGGQRLLLEADAVVGQQQIVIKDLGPLLRGIPGISGCAVLGAGRLGFILNQATLGRVARDGGAATPEGSTMPPSDSETGGGLGAYLVFEVVGERFALSATAVQEIIPIQPLIPLPQAPANIHGVVNLRGQVVPVMDLRRRLRAGDGGRAAKPCIIVASVSVGAESARVGVLVDDAVDLLELGPDDLLQVPTLAVGETDGHCLAGIARSGEHLVMLLDLPALLRPQDLSLADTRRLVERLAATAADDTDA